MNRKFHIKKGDLVQVNAGEDKGKQGKVLEVFPDKERAIVEGINMISKHTKPNAKYPQGGIIKQEAPIVPNLKTKYNEEIVPTLMKEFGYKSVMQAPRLEKIVINQGVGSAIQDKKILEFSLNEITAITGQKAVVGKSTKDVSNFKLRKGMPIGVKVTLRKERMYEFLERLICSALPRIRDFKGINSKLDGKGNYTLGLEEQIIFPEIVMDSVHKIMGMNITFVTSANTDEEGFALLREFGLPFKKN